MIRSLLALVLATTLVRSLSAQAVLDYELYKRHNYNQTSDSGAMEAGFVKYDLHASVDVAAGPTIETPSITIPAGDSAGSRDLLPLGTTNDWTGGISFTSKTSLDNGAANGSYGFSVDGANATLALVPESYGAAASITGGTWGGDGHLQLQNGADQLLSFSGPTSGDFVDGTDLLRLTLRQQSTGTTFTYESTSLVSAFTIADGTLLTGASYDLELLVFHVTARDTTSLPGAIGLAGFASQTFAEVDVSAGGAVPEPATYACWAGLASLGLVVLRRRRPVR